MLFYTAKLGRTSIRARTLAYGLCSWSLVEIHGRGLLHVLTLIKKKIKFSSYIRKFIVEQLQSHI
jgi:hypothetical protein